MTSLSCPGYCQSSNISIHKSCYNYVFGLNIRWLTVSLREEEKYYSTIFWEDGGDDVGSIPYVTGEKGMPLDSGIGYITRGDWFAEQKSFLRVDRCLHSLSLGCVHTEIWESRFTCERTEGWTHWRSFGRQRDALPWKHKVREGYRKEREREILSHSPIYSLPRIASSGYLHTAIGL